ncbi:hypothetical protein JDO7802_00767 [Jannaschia donghaensis]|uniref:Uncharacterized protein n=1 Tax=Jannaschia donghaensis TaxID=420998 RepID=A0A0M6YEI6_9RHOB|nr:hypothetical protein JDO7802_00767 [Jannaschia donghaensis]
MRGVRLVVLGGGGLVEEARAVGVGKVWMVKVWPTVAKIMAVLEGGKDW